MRRNLLALFFGLLVSVFLAELALRLIFEPPPTWNQPQTRHLESALLGWVLPSGSSSYSIDAPVSVNSHGLRDDEFPRQKPSRERRILALGDSFTFALGVRFEDLYVQQLEQRLREAHPALTFQVINAGTAGYNTRQELTYLLAEGLDFEPDLVIVGFYWNDLLGNEEPLPDLATPRVAPGAKLMGDQENTLPPWIRDRLRQSLLLYQTVIRLKALRDGLFSPPSELQNVQHALLAGEDEVLAPYWKATGLRLRQLADAAARKGVPVILVAFPMENETRRDAPSFTGAKLREIWEPTGMPFVDLDAAYRASLQSGSNPFLPYDLHPGPVGMRIAANAIYDVIREHDLLSLSGGD